MNGMGSTIAALWLSSRVSWLPDARGPSSEFPLAVIGPALLSSVIGFDGSAACEPVESLGRCNKIPSSLWDFCATGKRWGGEIWERIMRLLCHTNGRAEGAKKMRVGDGWLASSNTNGEGGNFRWLRPDCGRCCKHHSSSDTGNGDSRISRLNWGWSTGIPETWLSSEGDGVWTVCPKDGQSSDHLSLCTGDSGGDSRISLPNWGRLGDCLFSCTGDSEGGDSQIFLPNWGRLGDRLFSHTGDSEGGNSWVFLPNCGQLGDCLFSRTGVVGGDSRTFRPNWGRFGDCSCTKDLDGDFRIFCLNCRWCGNPLSSRTGDVNGDFRIFCPNWGWPFEFPRSWSSSCEGDGVGTSRPNDGRFGRQLSRTCDGHARVGRLDWSAGSAGILDLVR